MTRNIQPDTISKSGVAELAQGDRAFPQQESRAENHREGAGNEGPELPFTVRGQPGQADEQGGHHGEQRQGPDACGVVPLPEGSRPQRQQGQHPEHRHADAEAHPSVLREAAEQ